MPREPGISIRLKFTLSYAGFLIVTGLVLLAAVWYFLLRGRPSRIGIPSLADFPRVFDPSNFGPMVFVPAAIMLLGFLLVFGLVGGWFLSGHMLAPLSRITEATRQAARGSLSHRIRMEGPNDEFRELADAFDSMLAELEAHVEEQQRFAANASHELRTPLAITRTLLDVARNDPSRQDSDLDERLRTLNTRAIELTEALLLLSRARQRTFDREPVDLSLAVDEAVETLLPLAEQHDVSIDVSGGTVWTTGSHALLLQMTTNLLHNAIVHNRPRQGQVKITTGAWPGGALLTVENSGEIIAPEMVATLTEPFQRGTERIRSDHAGVGLGLAIVRSIIEAHDGTLAIAPRVEGGLSVLVKLPDPARLP